MEDRYLDLHENVNRLVNDYRTHGNIFVAFDFDNTVFDYHSMGDTFPKIENLLLDLKARGVSLILFTGNEGERLSKIISHCKERGYEPNYINENPIMKTRKPYYNILLDDRAGLGDTYKTLILTLKTIDYEQLIN